MDSFFFPGGFVFVVVVSETGKEPHRIAVSSADPQKRFGSRPRWWEKKA
jgi:hypothetical protein